MFFIMTTGRRTRHSTAETLDELGEKVAKAMANMANDGVTVAIGKTDNACMPYAWIHRDVDTDQWYGQLGDCIKLGIEQGSLIEYDPIQMLSLEDAVKAGLATVEDEGPLRIVELLHEPAPQPPKKTKKLSNEEKIVEARRMVTKLFEDIYREE